MPLSRRQLLVATAASVAAPIRAQTQTPRAPQVGKDYMVLKKPVPTDSGAKVEVLEFFQYSCPHCFAYDPFLTTWRKKLPPDVEYKRIPIAWDNSTMPDVRIYYTLEALGKLPEMHEKIFAAIQKNKQPLLDPDQIADFMAANGIDRKQWIDTYNLVLDRGSRQSRRSDLARLQRRRHANDGRRRQVHDRAVDGRIARRQPNRARLSGATGARGARQEVTSARAA